MHKPKPIRKISPRMVERQEELFGRLKALTSQVQGMAGRRPTQGVPQDVLARAEAMLFEVAPFRERRGRRELPIAAPYYGALAGQLAEALAALVAFETRHTQWDARFNEPIWSTTGHSVIKLKRLLPRPGSKAAAKAAAKAEMEEEARAARMLEIRALLVKRIEQYKMRAPELQNARPESAPLPDAESVTQPPPPRTGPSIRFL